MPRLRILGCIVLLIYTVMLFLAGQDSRDIVRDVTAEITATGARHALGTSACVSLLFGSALLYAVAVRFTGPEKRQRRFLLSQALMFAYLGADDYFQLHERMGAVIHMNDAVIQVLAGFVEIYLVTQLGEICLRDPKFRTNLMVGALLFGAMAFVDGNGFDVIDRGLGLFHVRALGIQNRMPYALEDLLKLWGCAFLFLCAWDLCGTQIERLAHESAEVRIV